MVSWSRFLFEKLTGNESIKEFPRFCGTGRLIAVFIRASLIPFKFTTGQPIYLIHFNIISHVCKDLPTVFFPSSFPIKIVYSYDGQALPETAIVFVTHWPVFSPLNK